MDSIKKLYIMRGHAGAGKTTYLVERILPSVERNGINLADTEIVSADSYFTSSEGSYEFDGKKLEDAHNECKRKFISAVTSSKKVVIVDNTNANLIDIAPYIEMGKAYGYDIEVIELWLDVNSGYKRTYDGPDNMMYETFAAKVGHHVKDAKIIERMIHNLEVSRSNWPQRWPAITLIKGEKKGNMMNYWTKRGE
jgi:predicted kinase